MSFNKFSQVRPIRSEPNPFDKSTIVSIFPLPICERKWTLEPGIFELPAGSKDNPAVLVVGTSSWWRSIHEDKSVLEIPTGSALIAKSIVQDFCNCMDLYSDDRGPGLFYIPGRALGPAEVIKEHSDKIELADKRQRRWFQEMISFADMFWSASGGNPRSIPQLAKIAAKELQIQNKPWMALEAQVLLTNCPACGHLRNGQYPICGNCHNVIDKEAYKALKLEKAV